MYGTGDRRQTRKETTCSNDDQVKAKEIQSPACLSQSHPIKDPSSVFSPGLQSRKRVEYKDFTDTFIYEIDIQIREVSYHVFRFWCFMVFVSYSIGWKIGKLERLAGLECATPFIAALLLLMSFFSLQMPKMYQGKKISSGVFVGALIIQFVAFMTDLMIAFLPNPVLLDPVTGSKVFLLRWCEWTPLAYMMTYLTEASDSPYGDQGPVVKHHDEVPLVSQASGRLCIKGKLRAKETIQCATRHAAYQGLSTLCGWFFPFCPGTKSWWFLMFISCALYSNIFYRLHARRKAFAKLTKGNSVDDIEMYQWAALSLKLLSMCAVMWTLLVALYFIYSFGPFFITQFRPGSLTMLFECVFDVLSKAVFILVIVDVHLNTFDHSARAQRRLEEMKQMMGVVWYNSSDVIGISVRNTAGDVTTSLSPTFLNIYSKSSSSTAVHSSAIGLSIDLDADVFKEDNKGTSISSRVNNSGHTPKIMYVVERSDSSDVNDNRNNLSGSDDAHYFKTEDGVQINEKDMSSVADLLIKAWKAGDGESLLVHDLVHNTNKIRCEANVTRIEKNSLVIVVRDISERFKRFEAEKKAISETTAREKDAEANRFTRHEVKNGLLAAIGLCDSLRESLSPQTITPKLLTQLSSHVETLPGTNMEKLVYMPPDIEQSMFELDKTLREILDTILAEAMARDVIHEIYIPKLERVDLVELLGGTNIKHTRFPIITKPTPLPDYALDPQLLKYIHRNAVSNACKYGKKGGVVRTEVDWDEENSTLKMVVINLPGENHDEILKLGDFASELVFSPRKRLPVHTNAEGNEKDSSIHSSGDGAWIVHKCAKTLSGGCSIVFEKNRTVFTFCCPATTYQDSMEFSSINTAGFELPKNIYGVAVDDSKVQRRILHRFFVYAGIAEDRIRILGATASELSSFNDWVVNFIDDHPDDYFLIIVDENLDIHHDQTKHVTLSGSLYVSDIRQRILPEQERRILALIRSANDSSNDIAIYNSRAHGYLSKSPVNIDNVIETLFPIWLERFPQSHSIQNYVRESKCRLNLHNDTDTLVSQQDLVGPIENINKLIAIEGRELQRNWPVIWEILHSMKGDLLTMTSSEKISTAIQIINSLRGTMAPNDFEEKWRIVLSLISMKEKDE